MYMMVNDLTARGGVDCRISHRSLTSEEVNQKLGILRKFSKYTRMGNNQELTNKNVYSKV